MTYACNQEYHEEEYMGRLLQRLDGPIAALWLRLCQRVRYDIDIEQRRVL